MPDVPIPPGMRAVWVDQHAVSEPLTYEQFCTAIGVSAEIGVVKDDGSREPVGVGQADQMQAMVRDALDAGTIKRLYIMGNMVLALMPDFDIVILGIFSPSGG